MTIYPIRSFLNEKLSKKNISSLLIQRLNMTSPINDGMVFAMEIAPG